MNAARLTLLLTAATTACAQGAAWEMTVRLPDPLLMEAYEKAATQNVLAAVNPGIFPGYWSVCADGVGHGHGNTYPALDGHQMADALLWLGQVETVILNWDYVRGFQRENGQLPFAILPALAGQEIGPEGARSKVEANGGLYRHWVPGDPLRALGYPTYIQNADAIFRVTQDQAWLAGNLDSINLAADFLATMVDEDGAVGGAGYYVERPTRVECDGVTQCHAVDAFRRAAELNAAAGQPDKAAHYRALAARIETHFRTRFWTGAQFVEYLHPERGAVASHGLTDVDWSAVALGIATADQCAVVWPKLRDEEGFRYGGMPTGIAAHPERYEAWEFSYGDRMDLAAMGRVWYLECQARTRMGDAEGLLDAIRRVCAVGRESGYYWRERYGEDGGYGVEKYCEYPANLIRTVQRFLLGVSFEENGAISLAPVMTKGFWDSGFGQTLHYRGRVLDYTFSHAGVAGSYRGDGIQRLRILVPGAEGFQTRINGASQEKMTDGGWLDIELPTSPAKAVEFTADFVR